MGRTRSWSLRIALLGAAVTAAFFVVAPAAPGASAGHSCPSFSKGGLTHQLFISNNLTCGFGKTWAQQLSSDSVTVDPNLQSVPLSNGPHGYRCFARARKKGRASTGLCYKGSLGFPRAEISWFGG
jgi:hypothetical protein